MPVYIDLTIRGVKKKLRIDSNMIDDVVQVYDEGYVHDTVVHLSNGKSYSVTESPGEIFDKIYF